MDHFPHSIEYMVNHAAVIPCQYVQILMYFFKCVLFIRSCLHVCVVFISPHNFEVHICFLEVHSHTHACCFTYCQLRVDEQKKKKTFSGGVWPGVIPPSYNYNFKYVHGASQYKQTGHQPANLRSHMPWEMVCKRAGEEECKSRSQLA